MKQERREYKTETETETERVNQEMKREIGIEQRYRATEIAGDGFEPSISGFLRLRL